MKTSEFRKLIREPGDFNATVGKIVNMDFYSWLNYDVALM